jgi:hypothetical protein
VIKIAKVKTINHTHVSLLAVLAILLSAGLLLNSIGSSKAIPNNLQSNKEVSKGNCAASGAPVISITQRVLNTVDSGEGGNNWAFDTVNRQIKVYKESENTFCVLVDNEGRFDSQAGQKSPGNTGVLTGKEDGTFKGGYRAVVTGSLKANPELQVKGNIGTVDYQCNIAGTCSGYFNWTDKYFSPGYKFSYEWWGWEYKYKNLKWINSSEGNSGDII